MELTPSQAKRVVKKGLPIHFEMRKKHSVAVLNRQDSTRFMWFVTESGEDWPTRKRTWNGFFTYWLRYCN